MDIKKWIFDNLFADYKEGYELQIQHFGKMIEELEEEVKKLSEVPEEIQEEKELEDSLNSKYPTKIIRYKGRFIPEHGMVEMDVRGFFINPECSELSFASVWKDLPDDQKAFKCLEWVIDNITYIPDKTEYGLDEFWLLPQESLSTRKGDCDDGAILLANLMLVCGVPYFKVRLTAGDITSGGHAYVTYFRESDSTWVNMDWCYYPTKQAVKARPDYKSEKNYGDIWFSWNKKYAFQKGVK
jgi:hypothetical protein